MSGPTSKSAWTSFERQVALNDFDSKRNPLSGANSRQDDGTPRGGDVIVPHELSVLVECKYRAQHAHHTLFEAVQVDAEKHGKKHAILYTKVKRGHGWLVVLSGGLWSEIVKVPQVQELLRGKT